MLKGSRRRRFSPRLVLLVGGLAWLSLYSTLARATTTAGLIRIPRSKSTVEPQLTAEQTRSAIGELRTKQLVLPIEGINAELLKGSYYQMRGNQVHHAVDILAPRNTAIRAADDGTIVKLWQSVAGGTTIYQF